MEGEEREDAETMCSAIKARFKEVYIADRNDSNYWKEHVDELRPGLNKVLHLKQGEEQKKRKPPVPLFNRPHHYTEVEIEFGKQSTLETTLGKRTKKAERQELRKRLQEDPEVSAFDDRLQMEVEEEELILDGELTEK